MFYKSIANCIIKDSTELHGSIDSVTDCSRIGHVYSEIHTVICDSSDHNYVAIFSFQLRVAR